MACSCGCEKCKQAKKKSSPKTSQKKKSYPKPTGMWLNSRIK